MESVKTGDSVIEMWRNVDDEGVNGKVFWECGVKVPCIGYKVNDG